MKFVAEGSDIGLGIQVSEDKQTCWAVFKTDSDWEKFGDVYDISAIPEVDMQPRAESPLTMACRILGQQNPQARRALSEIVQRRTRLK